MDMKLCDLQKKCPALYPTEEQFPYSVVPGNCKKYSEFEEWAENKGFTLKQNRRIPAGETVTLREVFVKNKTERRMVKQWGVYREMNVEEIDKEVTFECQVLIAERTCQYRKIIKPREQT